MCRRSRAQSLNFVRSREVYGVMFSVLVVEFFVDIRRVQKIGQAHVQQI
jgi:hypothetical protein